uniref:Uncharacterized protein n=1 Tax=Panagrolaimus davidi TaxID=227884 RepID=A0A914QVS6_9BILA
MDEELLNSIANVYATMFRIEKNQSKDIPTPKSIDRNFIAEEREQRISTRIIARIKQLSALPPNLPENLRIKTTILLKGLRLINLQAAVRYEVINSLKMCSTIEFAINPHAYRRIKRHTLREARIIEKLEKQKRLKQESRRKLRNASFLQNVIQGSKNFVEFHKNNYNIISKNRKSIASFHANSEKERQKKKQRNEKLRLSKLMAEDEEGYRKLLDEKKDKRLVYILKQTDEYVKSLTGLVQKHQQIEKNRKKEERDAERKFVENDIIIRNCENGEIFKHEKILKPDELETFHKKNPEHEMVSSNVALLDSVVGDEHKGELPKEVKAEEKHDKLDDLDERKILERARNEKDEYDQKTQMESYFAIAHKIKEEISKQHSSLGGGDPTLQLKSYQIKGLEWMISLYNNNLNGILADEMGLGKTIQTVALITYLMEIKNVNGPFLIIVPLSTISNWVLEFEKWAPHVVKVVYKGEKEARKQLDIIVKKGAFNVLLTTYEYVLKEKSLFGKIKWKYMIIDEGHRMKNHTCKLNLTLNAYFSAQHRLLLTGTPLQNKLPELWSLLNFLLPSIFSSCGTFEQWFNAPFEKSGKKVELNQEETMLIIRRLHKVLRPFLLRRLKKEVESELPEKTEQIIKCDMTCLQKLMYANMKNGLFFDNGNGRTLKNTIMQLKKLCNHPFLFPSIENDCQKFWNREINGGDLCRVSGKFDLLDRILPKFIACGHRILIFCQMTSTMTILEDYLTFKVYYCVRLSYLRLDGSTKHDERGKMLKEFNSPESKYNIFMLSTHAGGLGLNLQTADTVIIFDSDWNPHQDMQAQDRAHRIGQKKEVRVLRLITVNSIEEKILAAARYKFNIDEKVIQAGKFDQRSTDAERRQILEDIISREDDNDDNVVPNDEMINRMIARGDEELEIFQKMDQNRISGEKEQSFDRLIQENEIPENLFKLAKAFKEVDGNSDKSLNNDSNDGLRARKNVDYSSDLMTDQEFLKKLDENSGAEEDTKNPKSSELGRKKKKFGTEKDEKRNEPLKKKPRNDTFQDHLSTLLETLIGYLDRYV